MLKSFPIYQFIMKEIMKPWCTISRTSKESTTRVPVRVAPATTHLNRLCAWMLGADQRTHDRGAPHPPVRERAMPLPRLQLRRPRAGARWAVHCHAPSRRSSQQGTAGRRDLSRVHLTVGNRPGYRGNRPYRSGSVAKKLGYRSLTKPSKS
jgi:hypothetical protein